MYMNNAHGNIYMYTLQAPLRLQQRVCSLAGGSRWSWLDECRQHWTHSVPVDHPYCMASGPQSPCMDPAYTCTCEWMFTEVTYEMLSNIYIGMREVISLDI